MAMSRTLSLPAMASYDVSQGDTDPPSASKFPHTRAQLSAIVRQHNPQLDHSDDYARISSSFVTKVVGLLDEENEDELKSLLKTTYGMDDETVSASSFGFHVANSLRSWNRMYST
jgi:hypothetical protein